MNTLGGEIGLTGFYETTNPAKPNFDVGLKLTKVNIPSAFEAFTTVQALAPVAKYASGVMNTELHLNGALGKNMMPSSRPEREGRLRDPAGGDQELPAAREDVRRHQALAAQ